MHDEVSETENIRKNLSIERQIVEGCDMLLDVNQIFIRQGNWINNCASTTSNKWEFAIVLLLLWAMFLSVAFALSFC